MSQTRKLNTVVVGTSPFVSKVIADIKKAQHINLVGIVSRDKERAKEFSKKYDLPKNYTVEEALTDSNIDLVYLAVPNKQHTTLAIQFLQADKHVIVEKPMASTKTEVEAILKIAKEKNKFCMEALMYQCHPFIDQLLTVAQTRLSKIKNIKASYTADIYHLENKEQGGAIRNLGCYPLSLVRLLTGSEPISIKNCSGMMDEQGERDQSAKITLEFKGGLTAEIVTANKGNKFHELIIEGENGYKIECVTNPWFPEELNTMNLINPNGKIIETFTFKASQPIYSYEFDQAALQIKQSILSPQRPGVTWEHSLGNASVIEQWVAGVKKSHAEHGAAPPRPAAVKMGF